MQTLPLTPDNVNRAYSSQTAANTAANSEGLSMCEASHTGWSKDIKAGSLDSLRRQLRRIKRDADKAQRHGFTKHDIEQSKKQLRLALDRRNMQRAIAQMMQALCK